MAENVAPPREPPSPKFRSLRKAAAKVTGVSHAFSRRPKDMAAAPWERPDAACDPADDEAAAATREGAEVEAGPARDDAPAEPPSPGVDAAGDEAAAPAEPGEACEPGDVPESEKVWVLGYRVDPFYRFS
jgi:hypothetical protein